MRIILIKLIIMAYFLPGCVAPAELTNEGAQVQEIASEKKFCEERLREIFYGKADSCSKAEAKIVARNTVAKENLKHIYFENAYCGVLTKGYSCPPNALSLYQEQQAKFIDLTKKCTKTDDANPCIDLGMYLISESENEKASIAFFIACSKGHANSCEVYKILQATISENVRETNPIVIPPPPFINPQPIFINPPVAPASENHFNPIVPQFPINPPSSPKIQKCETRYNQVSQKIETICESK